MWPAVTWGCPRSGVHFSQNTLPYSTLFLGLCSSASSLVSHFKAFEDNQAALTPDPGRGFLTGAQRLRLCRVPPRFSCLQLHVLLRTEV